MFKNRSDAGEQLARNLLPYKPEHPLVLALPRGGVPVGFEVAKKLEAPLDTIVVRKIGSPYNPEFGLGAIAPGLRHAKASQSRAEAGNVLILDNISIQSSGLQKNDLDPIIARETQEMNRRMAHYKSGEYSKDAPADTAIIVDDGLATGVTARAAIESVKISLKPKKIIFAAPICARSSAMHLRGVAHDVVCVAEAENLAAIGLWYQEFNQTADEEVIRLLEEARNFTSKSKRR